VINAPQALASAPSETWEVIVMSNPKTLERLLVVSNRGPLVIKETAVGTSASRAVSGLVSAVEPVIEKTGGTWIAWCGRKTNPPGAGGTWPVPSIQPRYVVRELTLTPHEYRNYYLGFANGCLWPLAHSFIDRCVIDLQQWEAYQAVNRRFATAAAQEWREGDVVWVHDFHLALVPEMLRREHPQARIAFFWHIPFPSYDIFSTLPWARELLRGLLNCDSLAFHSDLYVDNFLHCASRILGLKVPRGDRTFYWEGRTISVRALPIGIDTERFRALASDPRVRRQATAIRRAVGTPILVLGADRLDYTKGILERLQAIEIFLEKYPEYRREITFLQVAVPTRTEWKDYRELRRAVEETVGRINGRFGEQWRVPVRYQFRSLSPEQLVAHYLAADIALVTPLRDGLNLVAKEYVACRLDNSGVLILSPFAGAAEQLTEAVTANPYHPHHVAEQLRYAVEMSPEEKSRRMKLLQQTVEEYDLTYWWQSILDSLAETRPRKVQPLSWKATPGWGEARIR
jgi:trehalose 6-phosphate synthase